MKRPIASASRLTGSAGGLPGFLTTGFGLGHGEDSGVGSGVVVEELELLLFPRKPTNRAARLKKDLGRAPASAGTGWAGRGTAAAAVSLVGSAAGGMGDGCGGG